MEVCDSAWDATRVTYGMGRKWIRDNIARHLAEVGRRNGFDVVDLTGALREAERGWMQSAYFPRDGHWNATGHRAAGETVAREMRRRRWIECPES